MKRSDGFWHDIEDYVSDLNKERLAGTDRGLVLVTSSMLDELLRRLLAAFMVDDDRMLKLLFKGAHAPIGSFSARTQLALALGLISKQEADCIDILRDIRNDYAHEFEGEITRRKPDAKDSNEARLRKLYSMLPFAIPYDPSEDFKEHFYKGTLVIISKIRDRFEVAFHEKRPPFVDPNAALPVMPSQRKMAKST